MTAVPEADRRQTIAIYLELHTLRETARLSGYSIGAIRTWVRAAGHPLRSERPQRYRSRVGPDKRRKVVMLVARQMRADGMTYQAIADHFGVTRQAVEWNLRGVKA